MLLNMFLTLTTVATTAAAAEKYIDECSQYPTCAACLDVGQDALNAEGTGLLETAASIIRSGGVAAGFRGVGARVCEFGISYTVTGAMSVLVLRLWPG